MKTKIQLDTAKSSMNPKPSILFFKVLFESHFDFVQVFNELFGLLLKSGVVLTVGFRKILLEKAIYFLLSTSLQALGTIESSDR